MFLLLTITSLNNTQNANSNSDEFIKQRIEFLDNLDAEQYKSDSQKSDKTVVIVISIVSLSMILCMFAKNQGISNVVVNLCPAGCLAVTALTTGFLIGINNNDKFNNRKHEKAFLINALLKKN
jgi:hypothetical protein